MKCSICDDALKRSWVNERMDAGISANAMERMSRTEQSPVPSMKGETIRKHIKHREHVEQGGNVTAVAPAAAPTAPATKKDLAEMVQEEVARKLEAGEARVTVQHGLQAQQMLDRRAERAKDRELAVTLAKMLHEAPPPDSLIAERPTIIIEGEVRDVG